MNDLSRFIEFECKKVRSRMDEITESLRRLNIMTGICPGQIYHLLGTDRKFEVIEVRDDRVKLMHTDSHLTDFYYILEVTMIMTRIDDDH